MTDDRRFKVSFFPVAEQFGRAAEEVNSRKGIKPNVWLSFVLYFCLIYVFLVPAILAYFDQYILAAISFLLILAVSLVYQQYGKTNAYIDFYRQSFEKHPERMQVELGYDGIRTSCDDCSSFFSWKSVLETRKEDEAIYFLTKDCGIVVPTAAFESPEDAVNFFDFAQTRIGRS